MQGWIWVIIGIILACISVTHFHDQPFFGTILGVVGLGLFLYGAILIGEDTDT